MAALPLTSTADDRKLRIVHVLRAPIGGLFRHVLDLAREQIARGHSVGLVTDSTTGGARAVELLADLEPKLELGLLRLPMRRNPHIFDVVNVAQIAAHASRLGADIVHGHGSKGGLYARLPGLARFLVPWQTSPVRAYTPHGGSFNYRSTPLVEKLYMAVEYLLAQATDIFLFESAYIARCFTDRVGEPRAVSRVVANGIGPAEFIPVVPDVDAADFLYVGELRAAKGIDTLIDALALLGQRLGRVPRLVLVGSGPDECKLMAQAADRKVDHAVSFAGVLPAAKAFRLGRILVVPSRAESLPYIVLEAAAAQVPMVSTNVGGIGEIFGPYKNRLIDCDRPDCLADELVAMLAQDDSVRKRDAENLAQFVATKFKITDMADNVLLGYRDAMGRKAPPRRAPAPSLARSG
jgi:glycosyltransferase involved in cell wall biosynthesis